MKRRVPFKRPEAPARVWAWRILRTLNWGLLIVFFGGVGVVLGAYSSIAPLVPYLRDVAEIRISEGTRILSAEGELLGRVSEENREFLPLEEVPEELKDAVIATEDTSFYRHAGVDPRGIMRALMSNLLSGHMGQGGSTITQQLARNAYNLTRQRSLQRKLQEFLLALEIERKYTKDEILELYLNEIYFGERAYGLKVAAKTYFNKEPSQLTLAECALLAGLPKAPTFYNPFRNPESARERRDVVLARMAEVGYIDYRRAQMAKDQPVKLARRRPMQRRIFRAPYLCAYAIKEAEKILGPEAISRGGLTIQTTVNWGMQQEAEKEVLEGVRRAKSRRVSQGALVALEANTGAIKAMVGGLNYYDSEFNRAVQSNRQLGSAFKPFVYTTAIDLGKTPNDYIMDTPVCYPDGKGGSWCPKNYGGGHKGRITLTTALALSINVAAVKLMAEVGVQPVIEMATRMGLPGPLDPYLPLALGSCSATPLEMASAFGVLASGGYRSEPYSVAKIEDAGGGVVYQHQTQRFRVLRESTAQTMNAMMEQVVKRGTAAGAYRSVGRLPFFAAGKTGTTSDYKDAWFIGWAEGLVCAVWVGNDTSIQMARVAGGTVPAPIWMRFIKEAVPIFAQGKEKHFAGSAALERLAESAQQRAPARSAPPSSAPPPSPEAEGDSGESPPGGGALPPVQLEKTPPAPPVATQTEMVGVCAVTGQRATPYCPRILLRSFPAGQAPTATCHLHPDPYRER